MSTQALGASRITDTPVSTEMRTSFMSYAMSVVVSRALPDVRDGLKPVHRRILYSMSQMGVRPDKPHVKCAKVVGDVMGNYHPHGDSAIYEALVRLAQDFSMRLPLVDGHGNFGTHCDPPAAARYCTTGDALVRFADGTTHRLGDIAADHGLTTWGEAGVDLKVMGARGEPVVADKIFHSGHHPVRRLRTRGGMELTGTHNHPVLTLTGAADGTSAPALAWKRLDQVAVGDHVAALRAQATELGAPLTQAEEDAAMLFGSWVSEGWYTSRAGFNNTDKVWFDRVEQAYRRLVGGRFYVTSRVLASGKPIYEIDIQNLSALDASALSEMKGLRSADKCIPAWVWQSRPGVKALFLQALFEGDGSFATGARNSIRVSYATKSSQLASDVQQLLLEFGVISSVYSSDRRATHFVVQISNRRDARIFADRVGFLTRKQAAFTNAVAALPTYSTSTSADHVPYLAAWIRTAAPRGNREWLSKRNLDRIERWERDDELLTRVPAEMLALAASLTDGTHHFTPVVSIGDAGTADVYSLRIATDEHAFITNGLVSHNTECRMATSAVAMTAELGEDTVDFRENYDGTNTEPKILPAAFPNLIVNGCEGIAVGMATRMAPHNLGEAVAACQYLLEHPNATVEDMIAIIPGPDLPTGGIILNVAGAHEAYRTGRGAFRIRARATIEDVSARRKAIVVTELPYQVGPEHVITRIKALRDAKRLPGVFNVIDLSDMRTGMRLVIETKTGYNPHAVLAQLYALTPLEESFTIHALALVGGFPRTLNLLELVQYYVDHRLDVTRRRCEYRRRKAAEQAHLLEGYLIALARIEEVVATIRASRDTAVARTALMASYLLSVIQASAILEMPLRRLTSLEVEKITTELADLHDHIAELTHLLSTPSAMNELVSGELAGVAGAYGTPRASTIATEQESADAAGGAVTMEIPDEPVRVTLSTTGLVAAWKTGVKPSRAGAGDVLAADLATTTRATLGAVTNTGRLLHVSVVELPTGAPASRGVAVGKFVDLVAGERVLTLMAIGDGEPPVALATAAGVIKRVAPKDFAKASGESIIGLKDGDEVVSALAEAIDGGELVLVTSDAQLLRFAADQVRAQGRSGGGIVGVRLSVGVSVLTGAYLAAGTDQDVSVLTVTDTDMVKVAPLSAYPAKGRGTGGVRAMRFTRGSTALVVAAVAATLAAGSTAGAPVVLPPTVVGTRDGAGVRVPGIVVAGTKR